MTAITVWYTLLEAGLVEAVAQAVLTLILVLMGALTVINEDAKECASLRRARNAILRRLL